MTAARCAKRYTARPVGELSAVEIDFLKGAPLYMEYK